MTAAPLVVYPLARLGKRLRTVSHRSQEALERLSHVAAEAFSGHRIVKAFLAEGREAAKFRAASDQLYRTNMSVTGVLSLLPPLMEALGGVAIVGALWYGSKEIAAGRLTPGEFTSFVAALLLMYGPIKKLTRVNANLQQAAAAAERVFELMDAHTEVVERPGAVPLPPFCRAIEYRDVSFGYEDGHGKLVLSGVSFTVPAGHVVAIVGRSGAGKTTLANLLPRFYDVSSGALLIDGHDVRDVTLASLRRQIGVVTQETVLFDDTIAANIAYGMPDASPDRIEAAARAANAHDFIQAQPAGYQTTHRRARPAPVGRPAPAAGDRPRAAARRADPGPRRGHLVARLRVRAAGPGGAGDADARPHLFRHRPPALDRAARRRDPGVRSRPAGRGRPARRAAGAARRGTTRVCIARSSPEARRPDRAGCAEADRGRSREAHGAHDEEHDRVRHGLARRRRRLASA